jgi:uncharacterized protein YqjF (DUF2071 family)
MPSYTNRGTALSQPQEHGAIPYGPICDAPVQRAAMVQGWDRLTFLHWRFEPAAVQRLLPPGLAVDTFEGWAWVGLVPFCLRVALPGLPSLPWASRFPETNVRTYVTHREGARGIWFFSLDAARLGAVLVARATYRLPYFWSRMSVEASVSRVVYRCWRRWPGPRGAASEAVVEIGPAFQPHELGELDHFLTARWRLFSASRAGLSHAPASHAPWPLHRARIVHLEDGLLQAAGLPKPQGDPLVHYSPTVEVRLGAPKEI